MNDGRWTRRAGTLAMAGGALGIALTPLLVAVKYATGWKVVPEPAWLDRARPVLGPLTSYATPVELWVGYGFLYTAAIAMMLAGLFELLARSHSTAPRGWTVAFGALLAGLGMVMAGDALHTATWHAGGETLPRPNLNAPATAGISIEYLGLPVVFLASLALGLLSLRAARLPRPAALLLVAAGPVGIALTLSQAPAMPSGPLLGFCAAMIVLGRAMSRPAAARVAAGEGAR